MKTVNIIQCPYCGAKIEPWDYIEPWDIEGNIYIDCKKCGEKINIVFERYFKFITSKC